MPFTENVNILELKLRCTGSLSHITEKVNAAKHQLLRLRRFYKLKPELIIRLYIMLIRPIMEYPPILMSLASNTSFMKMQKVQNRALKQTVKETADRNMTIKDIHEKFGIEAINVRLSTRLAKLWNKLELSHPDLHQRSIAANDNDLRDHFWWPRAGGVATLDPPEPLYTL